MRQDLLARLKKITSEEQELLHGSGDIQQELYTSKTAFVIDSRKLLEKGRLIEIRPHTRFAYFPRHRHDYVEMVYMCSGSTTHIINGKDRIKLLEGDLLFLNQTVYHEILPAGEDDIAVNFIILPAFFDRAITMIERENVLRDFLLSTLSSGSSSSYLHIPTKDIVPVQNLIENMIWTLIHHRHGTNTLNQTTMGLLFLNLSLFADRINQNDPRQREQALVFSILKYIESHYKSGTLADISALIKLPTYTVSRLLKRHTGLNFKELLQKRKLEQAAYLLSNTPLTVDAIRENIGYDNSSYFYRCFKDKYGCSPANFRQEGSQKG